MHGGKLPGAADGVHQFDVNLGAIKRGFAHNRLVGNIHLLQDLLQRADGAVPVLLAADKALFIVGVPDTQLDLVFSKAKSLEHGHGEFHAAHDFALNLLRRAEDVGVILGKAAHAQQTVHHAGTLVTVHRAQLAVTLRQVAIRAHGIRIDEDVAGAVHGLHAIFRVVELHGSEHVLRVIAFMAAGLPQVHSEGVRRVDERIAAFEVLIAHPVFHLFADDAALGMPEDQSRSGQLLDAEQVKLLAQHAMVALLGLFDGVQVLLKVLLVEERGAIDALELRIFLVAQPVGAGDAGELKSLDPPGGGNVRPAAEVHELAIAINGDRVARFGELLNEVDLHKVAFSAEAGQPCIAREELTLKLFVALGHFAHALFDLLQVFRGEGRGTEKIIEKPAIGRRAVAQLGLRKKLKHGGGEQVGGRVPVDVKGFLIAVSEQTQVYVLLQGSGEVGKLPAIFGLRSVHAGRGLVVRWRIWNRRLISGSRGLYFCHQGRVCQTRADGAGNIERRGAAGDFFFASVGKRDLDVGHVCSHTLFVCGNTPE